MKKLFIILSLAIGGMLFFGACSCSNGPEAVATKAVRAFQKGDYDAYAATYNVSEADQKMIAEICESKAAKEMNKKGGIKKFSVVESTIDGDEATVKMRIVYGDGSVDEDTMEFVKVGNTWKQDFSK